MRVLIFFLLTFLPTLALASPYAIVDSIGNIVNMVEWDGVSPWSPPVGTTAVLAGTNAQIGGTYNSSTGVFTPYTPPPPTPAQQAATAIAKGVNITSTGTSSLNGTYGVDAASQANLNGTITYVVVNGIFPGGASTMPWYDIGGNAHVFPSITEFKAFATALANYVATVSVYAASNGQAGSLPSNQITIP